MSRVGKRRRFGRLPAGLPDLAGPWLIAYRTIWLVALAGAIAVQASALLARGSSLVLAALGLAQGTVLVCVAALLFRRRPADPVAAMLSLAFLLWAITGAADGTGFAAIGSWIGGLDRLRFLLLVAAVLLFPSGRFAPRWTAPVLAASVLVFLVGMGGELRLLPRWLFLPPAALCVAAAILALGVRLLRGPACTERQQLKWVMFGLAVGLVLILVYRVGIALAPAPADMSVVLLLEASFRCGVMLMALGFLVSLLRYRLYDAEVAISRSAAYLALTLSLVAIFAASEAMIELVGQRYLGNRVGDLAGGIAAALAAVLIAPLHQKMSAWAEQHFQRDLVVLRDELPGLLADAREHADVASLSAMVLPRLEAGLRSTHIALVLDGSVVAVNDMPESMARSWLEQWRDSKPDGLLETDQRDRVFPLRMPLATSAGERFGWVLFGPRPDGSFYRHDELEALAGVAIPLRHAVAAVRDRERQASEAAQLRDRLLEAVANLTARVRMLERAAPRRSPKMRILHRTHSEPEV